MSSDAVIVRGSHSTPLHARRSSIDYASNRQTAATIRKISRLIKLIPRIDDAASMLSSCMQGKLLMNDREGYDFGSLSTFFETELNQLRMKKLNRHCSGWIRNVEDHFVEAIYGALTKFRIAMRTRKSPGHTAAAATSVSNEDSEVAITPSFRSPEQTSVLESIALISDDSEGIIEEEEEIVVAKTRSSSKRSADCEEVWNSFWFIFLEHLNLCVTSNLIRGKGLRCKIYDVYQFARPTRSFSSRSSLDEIRGKIFKELVWIINGNSTDSGKNALEQNNSNCRVYLSLQNERTLWLQINLGPVMNTKQNLVKEFTIVVSSESPFVAVATNRMSGKKRYISYVLSSVEAALADYRVVSDLSKATDLERVRRLEYLSSVDPYELLTTVQGLEQKRLVGGIDTVLNTFDGGRPLPMKSPVSDLHSSATGSLYETANTEKLLHPLVKRSISNVDTLPSLLLKDDSAPSDGIVSRKRSLYESNTPRDTLGTRKRVRWDWTGVTNAAAMCYDFSPPRSQSGKNCSMETVAQASMTKDRTLVPHKFKCRVTMEGTNVLNGIKALVAAGYTKDVDAIPHFVKDLNALGDSHKFGDRDIICVEHGDVVLSKSAANSGNL